ncbi:GAF domain-containing protein [Nakamurella sp. GG22]
MAEGWDVVRDGLTAAVGGSGTARAVAKQLCLACVDLLGMQGAGLWLVTGDSTGHSLSRCGVVTASLEWSQFSAGKGPCWEAVETASFVTAPDLTGADSARWPAFTAAAAAGGVRAVFAMPVTVAGVPMGALYLCRSRPGRLTGPAQSGAFLAGELAALPLLDLIAETRSVAVGSPPSTRSDIGWLTRSEVYQAVGMITAQLGVHPAEAMLRLRGHAFAHDLTVSQVAFQIIERQLQLDDDGTGTDGWHDLDGWPESGGGL